MEKTASKSSLEEIYDMVSEMTKARIEKEKETSLSKETYRMISLTLSLSDQLYCVRKAAYGSTMLIGHACGHTCGQNEKYGNYATF